MLIFPEIQKPSITSTASIADNSLKSEMINGMQITRPRYSRQLRSYDLTWNAMPAADMQILQAFYGRTFGGALPFQWQDISGRAVAVRFAGNLNYTLMLGGTAGAYACKVSLQEV